MKVDPEKQPVSVQAMIGEDSHAESWRRVLGHLETSTATYWLATSPDGTPQVRPVLAVWVGGGLYFCAGERTRKARNLGIRPDCAVTVEVEPIDLVVEGKAVKVGEPETLRRVLMPTHRSMTGMSPFVMALSTTQKEPPRPVPLHTRSTRSFPRRRSHSARTNRFVPHAGPFGSREAVQEKRSWGRLSHRQVDN